MKCEEYCTHYRDGTCPWDYLYADVDDCIDCDDFDPERDENHMAIPFVRSEK